MSLDLPRSASVLLPTFQAVRYLERVLAALAVQDYDRPWDLVVLDCGSTDGTLELLESWRPRLDVPLAVHTLTDVAFDHGDARNRLAAESTGELLVYLTDDAIPAAPDWLTRLADCFAEPRVAAAYCRNVPRADARPFARVATLRHPTYAAGSRVHVRPDRHAWLAMGPEELRDLYAHCDTASALRRSIWERHPYPPCEAGEDVLLARALVDAGYAVRYAADAAVLHTHEWDADRVRRRAVLDGRFNSEAFGRAGVESREVGARFAAAELELDAVALAAGAPDGAELRGDALATELAYGAEQRRAFFEGLLAGQLSVRRSGVRRLPTRVLDSPCVSVLLVHDTSTSAAALLLRDELVARGHECAAVAEDELASPATRARIARAPDVVHVLARADGVRAFLADAGFAAAPAIVPVAEGWELLPLGVEHAEDAGTRVLAVSRLRVPDGAARALAVEAWESRYRAVAAAASCDVVLDLWARECDRREGAVEPQGSESLLLGRAPACIEFDLGPLPPAGWLIEVHLELLADEPHLALVGRIEVDGREVGRISPTISGGRTRIEVCTADVPGASSPRRLCLRNGAGSGGSGHLRVRRIRLVRTSEQTSAVRLRDRLRDRLRSLRVRHGAPLDEERLPRVGVVIVSLLGRPLVEPCLAALESCDYPADRVEVVVVDNDSRTGLAAFLAARHPRTRLVEQTSNIGFTRGVAAGVAALGSAEILVLLNDDVVVERAWLRELVSPIARGECASTGSRMVLPSGETEFDGGGATFQGFAIGSFAGDEGAVHPRLALFACGGAMAVSLSAWRDVGGLDPEYFAYYDDLDLGWRLWITGREVHYVPSAVCRHARSSTSRRLPRASVRRLQVRNALITCLKNYDDASLERLLPALLALATRRSWVQARRIPLPDLELDGRRPRPSWRRLLAERRKAKIDACAFADLAALNEVLGAWDHWMARRADVQSVRRRAEAEILGLFLDPLRCVESETEYVALQRSLTDRLRLAELFAAPARFAAPPAQLEHARGCLEDLELRGGELTCAGWIVLLDARVDEVVLHVDGRALGSVRTIPRADVTAEFPGAPSAVAPGFRLTVPAPAGIERGWHRLEVFARHGARVVGVLRTEWCADALAHYPDPPPHLKLRVAGGTAPAVFKLDGLRTASDLLRALGRHGRPSSSLDVLDFGAGCGRVTGYLRTLRPAWRTSACDVDAEAVAWAAENHPGCRFVANPFDPPSPFAAHSFDVVLSYSVLTHFDAARQRAWLAEMRRILRPGGILVATVQGPHAARLLGYPNVVAHIDAHGIEDRIGDPALDAVLPEGAYRATFQSEAWTRATFGAELEVLSYERAGASGWQDVVVARARDAAPRDGNDRERTGKPAAPGG